MWRPGIDGRAWPRRLVIVLALAIAVGGCGGSHRHSSLRTATVLMAHPPGSLDPAVANTPEALEADWLAYTPLLTYVHTSGTPGSTVIPAIARDLPKITDSGRVYSFTLRRGLTYSNGQPVRASDFVWAVKRAIKLWPQAARLTNHIVGASAFASGHAHTISGVTADDATGIIRVHLRAPYGEIENVLASPALAPVPTGTPLRDLRSQPPPGIGPYELTHVAVGQSFSLVKNPLWKKPDWVDYLPTPGVDINVRITGDPSANALAVLDEKADAFDWSDEVPTSLVPMIEQATPRQYQRRTLNDTYLIFLNSARKPFSNQLAREAVRAALDQNTLVALDNGRLLKGCYLLPPSLYGHPHDACPDGNKAGDGNLPVAKALAKESGMAGTRVTVWAPASSTFAGWMAYYTSLLNQLGFKASLRTVPPATYYKTIGEERRHPQTGFDALDQAYANPVGFYAQLEGSAIKASGNTNFGEIDDPYINNMVRILSAVPASNLDAVASFWHELELYVAEHAYVAVLGYPTFPDFVSRRIDLGDLTFSPAVGYDWSSFKLK